RMQQNGSLVTVAGGGSQYEGVATKSNLFGPAGLAVAPDGDLYIADNLGTAIRKVDRFGMLSTFIAIHATGGGNSPVGITLDQDGPLYVANFGGDVVAIAPRLVTSKGELSSSSSPRINTRGIVTTVAGTGVEGYSGDGGRAVNAQLAYPAGLAMVQGRLLYVADGCGCMDPAAYGAVRVIDLSTGTITTAVSSRSRVVS